MAKTFAQTFKLKRAKPTQWLVIAEQQYSENIGEYGYGDFPEQIAFIMGVVEGGTERKAQAAARKRWPRVRFGGVAGKRLVNAASEQARKTYLRYPDPRLSQRNAEAHYAALHEFIAEWKK